LPPLKIFYFLYCKLLSDNLNVTIWFAQELTLTTRSGDMGINHPDLHGGLSLS
jgi:hypothetical protein